MGTLGVNTGPTMELYHGVVMQKMLFQAYGSHASITTEIVIGGQGGQTVVVYTARRVWD
jgi:hypothetical protein